jgi:radical SAM superfamily enzyme YgiQ (UPF0313 family)
MARIVLINPRFEISNYGLEHALPFLGAKAIVPVACLPLLAALTPAGHQVTLIDENVEPIDFARCADADIVGITGMVVQRARMREILVELRRRGRFTVVGGPWVTVWEDEFGDLADVVFIGEAEESWPRFLEEWQAGRHQRRYEQADKTDMSTVPPPRFDLMKMRHYAFGSVQFSRGCPFACEFCDIIVVFGRRPRIKTSAQVIAELEALLARGIDTAFVVDDNLIGNKKAIKEVLKAVVAWQQAKGYRMTFLTEASLDLADDAELLRLMVDANFTTVFIGIESPNEASLRETKKFQNLRKGGTMIDKVHAIQRAGLEVWSGMILGFDNDDASIFDAQRRFIREARIVNALVNMLVAIPKTPLYERLTREGRFDAAGEPVYGTNIVPLRMSREDLRDGAYAVMRDLYEPKAYFDRLDALYLDMRLRLEQARMRYLGRRPWQRLKVNAVFAFQALAVFVRLMQGVPDPALRREYRRRLWQVLKRRPAPIVLRLYAIKCAMHYHLHIMIRQRRNIGTGVDIDWSGAAAPHPSPRAGHHGSARVSTS